MYPKNFGCKTLILYSKLGNTSHSSISVRSIFYRSRYHCNIASTYGKRSSPTLNTKPCYYSEKTNWGYQWFSSLCHKNSICSNNSLVFTVSLDEHRIFLFVIRTPGVANLLGPADHFQNIFFMRPHIQRQLKSCFYVIYQYNYY